MGKSAKIVKEQSHCPTVLTRLIFYRLIYIEFSKMSSVKSDKDLLLSKFGKQVRKIRLAKNLSQEKLADLAGLHWTYISGIERGIRNISLKNIVKISKALELKLKNLLDF